MSTLMLRRCLCTFLMSCKLAIRLPHLIGHADKRDCGARRGSIAHSVAAHRVATMCLAMCGALRALSLTNTHTHTHCGRRRGVAKAERRRLGALHAQAA